MCVIIAKPKGASIPDYEIESCWKLNDDGAGIAWAEGGKVHIKKGFMQLKDFKTFWSSKDWTNIPAILHFRIATHGAVNKENCHPFWVHEKSLAFAHNGVFHQFGSAKKSDTVEFNNKILRQIPKNFIRNSGIRIMLEDFCGIGSKIAFINKDGVIDIVREEDGFWSGGCWYSNLNHTLYQRNYKNNSWECLDGDDTHDSDYKEVTFENIYGDIYDLNDLIDLEWWLYDEEYSKASYVLGSDVWYCYHCMSEFNIEKVEEVDIDDNNVLIPRCPSCNDITGVYPRPFTTPASKEKEDEYNV